MRLLPHLRAPLARRAREWARRRQGSDHLPLALDRRRIYILPTRLGTIYAFTLVSMLLASLNYNNSMGFALTFLLGGLALVAMVHCHRNLAGLVVEGIGAGEAFAGSPVALRVGCENPSAVSRYALTLECEQHETTVAGIAAGARTLIELELPTEQRGVLRPQRLVLSTRFPLGLFRAWTWLHVPVELVVYPRPAGQQVLPATAVSDRGVLEPHRRGDEDFRGFRDYRPGDSPRHVAWKAVARGGPLLVKDFAGAGRTPQILDLDAVDGGGLETRLAQLTQWVLLLDRQAASFGLALPGERILPAGGAEQRRRCLAALARYGLESAS